MDTIIVVTVIYVPLIFEISKKRYKHDCHDIFVHF